MGWAVLRDINPTSSPAACSPPPFQTAAYHSGGAVGASSALLILPEEEIVVAVFCNLQQISLMELSCIVAEKFSRRLSHEAKHPLILTTGKSLPSLSTIPTSDV